MSNQRVLSSGKPVVGGRPKNVNPKYATLLKMGGERNVPGSKFTIQKKHFQNREEKAAQQEGFMRTNTSPEKRSEIRKGFLSNHRTPERIPELLLEQKARRLSLSMPELMADQPFDTTIRLKVSSLDKSPEDTLRILVELPSLNVIELEFPERFTVDQVKNFLFRNCAALAGFSVTDYFFALDRNTFLLVEFLPFKQSNFEVMRQLNICTEKGELLKLQLLSFASQSFGTAKRRKKTLISSGDKPPSTPTTASPKQSKIHPTKKVVVDLQSYDLVKIVLLQRQIRKWILRQKLRGLVREWRTSPASLNLRLRNEALKEIVKTEYDYGLSLNSMIEIFYQPLINNNKNGTPILNGEEISTLFANLTDIAKLSTSFFVDLSKRLQNSVVEVGDVFLKIAVPLMQLYSEYLRNYDNAIKLLIELNARPNFISFLQQSYSHKDCIHSNIQFYLIMPVQRLPRYKMLLENLKKYTPENHKDYENCRRSLDIIEQVIQSINQRKREEEELFKVHHSLIWPDDMRAVELASVTRVLLFSGILMDEPPNEISSDVDAKPPTDPTSNFTWRKMKDRYEEMEKYLKKERLETFYYFLFNDMFLKAHYSRSAPDKYKVSKVYHFDTISIVNQNQGRSYAFQINLQTYKPVSQVTYTFFSPTLDEKEEWIAAFKQVPNAKYSEAIIHQPNVKTTGKILRIKVVEARGLAMVERKLHNATRNPNPYCVLTFVTQRKKTKIQKNSVYPKWNEYFELSFEAEQPSARSTLRRNLVVSQAPSDNEPPKLTIEVHDGRDLSVLENFMGRISIPFDPQQFDNSLRWYKLRTRNGEPTSGDICLRLFYSDLS